MSGVGGGVVGDWSALRIWLLGDARGPHSPHSQPHKAHGACTARRTGRTQPLPTKWSSHSQSHKTHGAHTAIPTRRTGPAQPAPPDTRARGDSAAATSNPGFQAIDNWARCLHAEAEVDDTQSWNISHWQCNGSWARAHIVSYLTSRRFFVRHLIEPPRHSNRSQRSDL